MKSRLLLAALPAALVVTLAGAASAEVEPGPAVCKIAALSEADNWEPLVSMMDIILENPEQTAEQRANAQAQRDEAAMMREAALGLAARFEGAPDPNPAQIAALQAMSEDDYYVLLDACDAMEDSTIAARIQAEVAIANAAATTRRVEEALAYVEGSVPFSTTIRDDYASRVNCSVAFEVRADGIRAATGSRNPDSAVYRLLVEWINGLVVQMEGYTGDTLKVSSDRLGVYPEWNDAYHSGSGYSSASDACESIIMGSNGPRPIPQPNSVPLSTSATTPPPPAPPRPVNLFTETYWLGEEIFYRFKPAIPNFFMGNARYGANGERQALLLQLLAPANGATAMIAHQYAVDCQAGTIWWLEERRLDSGGAILGVTPHADSLPDKPGDDLGFGILNATCGLGYTQGEARTAGGWRELGS